MRMHFWLDVARVNGRRAYPVNTSLNGAIPALTNMSVGSFCRRTEAEGQTSWPLSLKNSRNDARTCDAVWALMTPRDLALLLCPRGLLGERGEVVVDGADRALHSAAD